MSGRSKRPDVVVTSTPRLVSGIIVGVGIGSVKKPRFEVVMRGLTDESEAQRGRDIFYHCETCGNHISSQPEDSTGCKCGNIFIDADYVRLVVRDFDKFTVVERTT
jgi:hypothetical protein